MEIIDTNAENSMVDILNDVCSEGIFVDMSTYYPKPTTTIIQLFRKLLKTLEVNYSDPYDLPIGRFYDIYSGEIFCGTRFEFPNRYKVKIQYNTFSIFEHYEEHKNIRACSVNDRWSCFTDENEKSVVIVSNMCFNLDIHK